MEKKDIVLYYHALLSGNFKAVIQDQLTKVFVSGLYRNLSRLELCYSAPNEEDSEWLKNLVRNYSKINLFRISIDKSLFPEDYRESKITFQRLSFDAKINDAIFGFIHTKAITNTGYFKDTWRNSMDWCNIHGWKSCLERLGEGFDAVGPNLRYETWIGYYPHFSGGYWWTNSDYIRTLDDGYIYDVHNIYLEEFWIGSNHSGRLSSMFECGTKLPYEMETSIDLYIKEEDYA